MMSPFIFRWPCLEQQRNRVRFHRKQNGKNKPPLLDCVHVMMNREPKSFGIVNKRRHMKELKFILCGRK